MPKQSNPTTKFKVDISDLKKGITEANRQIRLANSEFKAASDGTKEWEDSVDGLSARITQFQKVLDLENKKLENLKEQRRRVVEVEGEHSKAAEELEIKINSQISAVKKTEKSLKDYSDALEEAKNKVNNTENELKDFSDSLKDIDNITDTISDGFTVLTGAIASLVADGIRVAISALKDFAVEGDRAFNSFQAKTGASAEEMARFGDEIESLYRSNYGESLGDVADSMAQVAQTSKEVDPSKVKELTENALTLRDTFDFEVSETMRAANMLVNQFGISGEEAFNLIVQGAQNGLDKNGDLLDSINEYSVHYEQLGYTSEEFFNSLMNGTNAGTFSVDKLGDAMKEFGIRTKDSADSTSEGFELIGLDADEMREKFTAGGESAREATQQVLDGLFSMDDAVQQNQAGVDLFGTMWEDLGIDGVKALMDVTGEADKMKTTMEDIKSVQYSDIGSQFSEIGRIIKTDFLQPIAEKALPEIKNGLTWLKDNLNIIVPIVSVVGSAIVAAFTVSKIVTFISFISKLVKAFTGAQTIVAGFKAVFSALNLTMAANPIGIVVTLIAGLVTAFITLWNTSDSFRAFWINIWNILKDTVSGVIDNIKEFFTVTIPSAFNTVINFFKDNWQGLLLFIVNPFAGGFKLLYDNFEGFKNTVDNFILAVINFFKQLPENIYNIIVNIMGHIVAWGVKLYNFATTDIPNFISQIINFFATLPVKIWEWLVNAYNKTVAWGSNMIQVGGEKALAFVTKVIEFFATLPNEIWEWLVESFNKIVKWGADMLQKGKEIAIETIEGIITGFSELPSKLYEVGVNALEGFWNGLKSVANSIKDWAMNFFGDILDKAKEVLEIASPSKAFKKIGKFVMQGFNVGMVNEGKKVLKHTRDTFSNVMTNAKTALDPVRHKASAYVRSAADTMRNVTYNFYQTNNSPKSLSRLEIYRQSKNLLKGVAVSV